MKCSEEDHGNHSREEEDNDQAIKNREPLDVCVGHTVQDVIPSAWPFYIIFSAAKKSNFQSYARFELSRSTRHIFVWIWQNTSYTRPYKFLNKVKVYWSKFYLLEWDCVRVHNFSINVSFSLDWQWRSVHILGARALGSLCGILLDTSWLNLDTHDTSSVHIIRQIFSPILVASFVIVDGYINMVEDVIAVCCWKVSADDTSIFGVTSLIHVASHGEASTTISLTILHWVTPCDWHVVNNPVMLVVHEHPLPQECNILLVRGVARGVLFGAQHLAIRVLTEFNLILTGSDSFTKNNLAQIFCRRTRLISLAEIETAK